MRMVRDDSEEVRGRPCSPSVSRRESQKGKSPRKTRPEITNTHRRLTPRRQRLGRQLPRVHKHGNYRKENRYPSGRSASSGQSEAAAEAPQAGRPGPRLLGQGGAAKRGRNKFCWWFLASAGCLSQDAAGAKEVVLGAPPSDPAWGNATARDTGHLGQELAFAAGPHLASRKPGTPPGRGGDLSTATEMGPSRQLAAHPSATSTSCLRSLGSPAVLPAKQGLPASLSPKGSRQAPTSFPTESPSPKAPSSLETPRQAPPWSP